MLDIRRLFRAAMYSFTGLRDAIAEEAAFRLEVLLLFILVPAALWLGEDHVSNARS